MLFALSWVLPAVGFEVHEIINKKNKAIIVQFFIMIQGSFVLLCHSLHIVQINLFNTNGRVENYI